MYGIALIGRVFHMNILIDMSSIRAGGGVQQAINFIENIEKTSFYEHRLYLLIPSQGALRKLARIPRVTYI